MFNPLRRAHCACSSTGHHLEEQVFAISVSGGVVRIALSDPFALIASPSAVSSRFESGGHRIQRCISSHVLSARILR
jgi:hypothetical protein